MGRPFTDGAAKAAAVHAALQDADDGIDRVLDLVPAADHRGVAGELTPVGGKALHEGAEHHALEEGREQGPEEEGVVPVDHGPDRPCRIADVPTRGPSGRTRLELEDAEEHRREHVAEFLEALARLAISERDRLLKDAQAIRDGRMPSSYQYMIARERQ